MARHGKIIIFAGFLLLLAGLLLALEPYYTWAQEQSTNPCRIALQPEEPLFDLGNMNPGDVYRSSVTVTKVGSAPAQLYLSWQWAGGSPIPGREGSLFEQLHMVVESGGKKIFEGPMSEWLFEGESPSQADAINITKALGMEAIRLGDQIRLDFTVTFDGPDSGNVFQGSHLKTSLVFFTVCTGNSIIIDPDDPGVDPDDNDKDKDKNDNDKKNDDKKNDDKKTDPPSGTIIRPETPATRPPLPRTDGASIGLLAAGIMLIAAGAVLRKGTPAE